MGRKVLLIGREPMTKKLGGGAIRQLCLARAVAKHFDVRLLSLAKVERKGEPFEIAQCSFADTAAILNHIKWADVVYLCQPTMMLANMIKETGKPLGIDLIPTLFFEDLENVDVSELQDRGRLASFAGWINFISCILEIGDFFGCGSDRERDYYLGMLTLKGKLRPDEYEKDPHFKKVIGVIPYGIENEEPPTGKRFLRGILPGLTEEDFIILWGSGIWNWYDATTPVKAMALLKERCPRAKMVFMSSRHPALEKPPTGSGAEQMLKIAEQEGLIDKNVLFNNHWVDYEERGHYLTESDIGIVTAHDHIENRFSLRIRVLDYLWAKLPTLTNPNNILADVIEKNRLGLTFGFGDYKELANKIEWMANNPAELEGMKSRMNDAMMPYRWDNTVLPLLQFCENGAEHKSFIAASSSCLNLRELNRIEFGNILYLRSSPAEHTAEGLLAIKRLSPNSVVDMVIQKGVDKAQFEGINRFIELPTGKFLATEAAELTKDGKYHTVICAMSSSDVYFYKNVLEFTNAVPADRHMAFDVNYQLRYINSIY